MKIDKLNRVVSLVRAIEQAQTPDLSKIRGRKASERRAQKLEEAKEMARLWTIELNNLIGELSKEN